MARRQICVVLFCMLFTTLACAAQDASSPRFGLSIRAGLALDEALQELARQSGVQLVFLSQITAGRSAPELSGEYTLDAAMTRLLEGSDLTFRQVNEHTIEVRQGPPPSARSPRARSTPTLTSNDSMQEVHVVAKAEQLVATRIPTPLQEIPQSISVISPEQIRQQNSFELGDVLQNTPGIAVRRRNSFDETAYSRAFAVTSFHEDGGGALNFGALNAFQGNPEMSEFDRVEVLRGSDALFSGNSDPGGTVSLVRKRPLATPSLTMSATLGSWNNYRVELDGTGPLTDDGALRGRADVVYATRDYFFDRAHQDRKKVFAVIEYDLTPTSMLTAGGGYQWDDALPLATPATLNSDGSDAHLPRSLGLTFDWAFYNARIGHAYVKYQQQFADDWILKLNASGEQTTSEYGYGEFYGQFTSAHSLGSGNAYFSTGPNHSTLGNMDATLTGKLDWFGLREMISIGADFTRLRARYSEQQYLAFGPPLMDPRTFDPDLYPDPRRTRASGLGIVQMQALEQYGGFVWLQVDATDAFSLTGGARVASDTFRLDARLGSGGVDLFGFSIGWGSSHVVQPYGALMYRINDHLSWYASYANIYRSPPAPLVRPDGSPVGPQHGITFESGIKGTWREGALNGSLALYRVEQRNVARPAGVTNPIPYCCYAGAAGRSRGADLEVNGELAPGWLIGSGYTYNLYGAAGGGEVLNTSTPRHALKIWTSAKLPGVWSRWTVGGSLRAQAKARGSSAYASACARSPCETALLRSYAVADLRAGFELDPNWQLALSVNNVLDKRYFLSQDSPSLDVWYGEPRSFMLRIDAKY